jgi:collagenase-like PrtC family protease
VTTSSIELLAPAKDASTGRTAILCGADAVYIGAERFSARQAAGNPLDAIRELVEFAHPYYAKVYVALNTILRDDELARAEMMIRRFHEIDVDGLIIQDVGLLELDLPPIPLIASTQMHNVTVEKVQFWEHVGFSRIILARELTLEEIRRIRNETSVELECFIHGALCVSASGQCYMSYALGARSGNRGQCAQPCRRLYSLRDRDGRIIVKDRYLLSLKDLRLADYLEDLIDAGVTSFKIEGRLKDLPYVANTVAFYRRQLDAIRERKGLKKSSSGSTHLDFEPNPAKTFNRGFTDYGITGRPIDIASMDTPKSIGELVGVVSKVDAPSFTLDTDAKLHNADGLCFFDRRKNLCGTIVNRVDGRKIHPDRMEGIHIGQSIYRNYDRQFVQKLIVRCAQRKIGLTISLSETNEGLALRGVDEDGNEAVVYIQCDKQPAMKKDAARQTIVTQLSKLGNTIFECTQVKLETQDVYFIAVSRLNTARRELTERLLATRLASRLRRTRSVVKNAIPHPEKHLTYTGNVLNAKAEAFYRRHGVETIEPAAESGLDMSGRLLMTTKHCLRRELGLCPRPGEKTPAEPLILIDEDNRQFDLQFTCAHCGMQILLR